MANFKLTDLSETQQLGRSLANQITNGNIGGLFLRGPLGCGKTTLVRYLVQHLSGADKSEISSPSFTVYNRYPTTPAILHCDLYRCQTHIPEELLEMAEIQGTILVVEWSEYFPKAYLPDDYLKIVFQTNETCRLLTMESHGNFAKKMLNNVTRDFQPSNIASS